MAASYSKSRGYTVPKRKSSERIGRGTIRPAAQRFTLGPTTARIIAIVAIAILGGIMLSRSSGSSTTAYEKNQLQREIGSTEQEIQQLKVEAQRAQALQGIEGGSVRAELVQPGSVQTITGETGSVAGASTVAPR
jgi:hypothetical protein